MFANASEIGLCIVAYSWFEKDDNIDGSSVMGKTPVAPPKLILFPSWNSKQTFMRHE